MLFGSRSGRVSSLLLLLLLLRRYVKKVNFFFAKNTEKKSSALSSDKCCHNADNYIRKNPNVPRSHLLQEFTHLYCLHLPHTATIFIHTYEPFNGWNSVWHNVLVATTKKRDPIEIFCACKFAENNQMRFSS